MTSYQKVAPPLDLVAVGLAVWDPQAEQFQHWKTLWEKSTQQPQPPAYPEGHAVPWTDADGVRWLLFGDPSPLGEIWYAEADSPLGPWQNAVKVLSHRRHTFYNPRIRWEMTAADSPILLFEGTFTTTFSDDAVAVPRYDYNQILYRLDLDDARLTGH